MCVDAQVHAQVVSIIIIANGATKGHVSKCINILYILD